MIVSREVSFRRIGQLNILTGEKILHILYVTFSKLKVSSVLSNFFQLHIIRENHIVMSVKITVNLVVIVTIIHLNRYKI